MDIVRTRGDTYADQFLIENTTTKVVVNLTGCTLTMTLNSERNPTDTSAQVYQLTGTSTDPTTGVINFAPSSTQANLVGLYYYDIQMVDSDGVIRTLVSGSYSYTQDITK